MHGVTLNHEIAPVNKVKKQKGINLEKEFDFSLGKAFSGETRSGYYVKKNLQDQDY